MINIPLNKILFIDIETVGGESDWKHFTKKNKELSQKFEDYQDWFKKRFPECSDLPVDEMFLSKSALVPEFAKIVCVSASFVTPDGELKTQSFWGEDEKELLTDVRDLLNKIHKMDFYLCGHNLKNFDIPMMSKRMVVNGILPPKIFPSYDTKPWEIKCVDTKEVWQFGNYSSLSSLELACVSMGIESSKNTGVSGNEVHNSYWFENGIDSIVNYCEQDVKVLVELIKKLKDLK